MWAARHEMARTVDDVLARRTRALSLNSRAALAMAPAAARLLELAWQRLVQCSCHDSVTGCGVDETAVQVAARIA